MPDLPIAGANGVYDGQDVVEFMMAGATVVEICSAVMLKGYPYIGRVVRQVEEFLDRKGYGSPSELVGLRAPRARAPTPR
jgi:dihydroorotate dehydrogenase